MISALRGGSGKTILCVGIIAAWNKQAKPVIPFKKGPDYIDAGWLALAAGRPCYNLETFLVEKEIVLQSFYAHAVEGDVAVIEGNRGLYDGIDKEGTTSSAELAKILKIPVILCVDCTKTTRTMAAVICGCIQFDPEEQIKGVVLNRVARASSTIAEFRWWGSYPSCANNGFPKDTWVWYRPLNMNCRLKRFRTQRAS